MALYAYCRVSTDRQDELNQHHIIKEWCRNKNTEVTYWRSYTISSRKTEDARGVTALFEEVEKGDRIIVTEISRLGRSSGKIAIFVDKLIKKGVGLIAIRENIIIGCGEEMNISTKIQLSMFALFAEIERDVISARTKEALYARKHRGMRLGRKEGQLVKSRLDPMEDYVITLLAQGKGIRKTSAELGVSRGCLENFIRTRNIKEKVRDIKEKMNTRTIQDGEVIRDIKES